jgi:hypothetical protein
MLKYSNKELKIRGLKIGGFIDRLEIGELKIDSVIDSEIDDCGRPIFNLITNLQFHNLQ